MRKSTMREVFHLSVVASTAVVASMFVHTSAIAQDVAIAQDIPSLQDVLGGMSETEVSKLESGVRETGALTGDVDSAIDKSVKDALEEGLIGKGDVNDVTATLQIVNANADYFNFDILGIINQGLAVGDFTPAEIRQTLEGFQNLSPAGKAIVGQRDAQNGESAFDANAASRADPSGLYNTLSTADKAIVLNTMPALTKEN